MTWDCIREATSSNDNMHALEEVAANGFPESRTGMPVAIYGFHQYRKTFHQLMGWSCTNRSQGSHILLLRGEVLSTLHAAHQGVSMMTAHAESSVFWPGMSADNFATWNESEHCHRMPPSQPAAINYTNPNIQDKKNDM